MNKPATAFVLFLTALLAAGLFGSVHDQVSYTVSAEYFTKFKFIQFGLLGSPLGERTRAAWVGFLASWYMGLPVGVIVARLAFRQRTAAEMLRFGLRSFAAILAITALVALGGLAYGFLRTATIQPANYSDWFVPADIVHIRRYLCAGYMHNAAYLGGAASMIGFTLFHYFAHQRDRLREPSA